MEPKKKTEKPEKHLKFKLLDVLEQSGMTRYEFAEKANLNYASVSDLVNEKYKRFGIETLEKICKALNVDVGDLFIWE